MSRKTPILYRQPFSLNVNNDEQQRTRCYFEDNFSDQTDLQDKLTAEVVFPSSPCEIRVTQQPPTMSEPTTRGFTSVNLTLRPASSEPQLPVDINSQGSNLTCSCSTLDPRSFQSRLQISIGHGNGVDVTAVRINSPLALKNSDSLLALEFKSTMDDWPEEGLLASEPSQATMISALMMPFIPALSIATSSNNLPISQQISTSANLGAVPHISAFISPCYKPELSPEFNVILNEVPDEFKALVTDQLIRKDRLSKALEIEKIKLESLKKEVETYTRYAEENIPPEEIEQQLRSEIYYLQLECDKLAEEIDYKSDFKVPLGETNEEFYQGIYTGQQYAPPSISDISPTKLSQLPSYESESNKHTNQELDGPLRVCKRCTFSNHPLMNKCEQCDIEIC